MVTVRNFQRFARSASVFVAMGAAAVFAAAPAGAASVIDITGATPSSIGVEYTCAATAGVTRLQVKVGEPSAQRPSALGSQRDPRCDGTPQVTKIALTGTTGEPPLQSGAVVQVRVALVDDDDGVVCAQVKLLNLE